MFKVENLTKRYGDKLAVDNISFEINGGEVVGFLGRNGAGKSTTMNMLTGYIAPTGGKVLFDGHDIVNEPRLVKRHIGYLPEQPPLYMDMTVDEYLRFVCAIKEINRSAVKRHIREITELVKIDMVCKRLMKNLSKGYKQRVGIAQALIGDPDVILLDEPTVGLDPMQIIEIRTLIRQLGKNHTLVLSSHLLHEVADVCQKVIILSRGKIVAEDSLENLCRGSDGAKRVIARIATEESAVLPVLNGLEGVRHVELTGCVEPGSVDFVLEYDSEQDIRKELFRALAAEDAPLLQLTPMETTLEDFFLKVTNDSEGV